LVPEPVGLWLLGVGVSQRRAFYMLKQKLLNGPDAPVFSHGRFPGPRSNRKVQIGVADFAKATPPKNLIDAGDRSPITGR
jgi:hypothetical protein